MNGKSIKSEAPVSAKLFLLIEYVKGTLHLCCKIGRKFQRVVSWQNPPDRQRPHRLHRFAKGKRVGRRIKRIQRTGIQQVAGKEIPACRLKIADVTGRMPRRVKNPNLPPAKR